MSNGSRKNRKIHENINKIETQEINEERPNNVYLNQLLSKNKDGSIPLYNFMKNTENFIRRYESLSHRVQEIEKQLSLENVEKNGIINMKPISSYFKPINLVEKKESISDVDNQLLRNLEFMEKQSQQVKELLKEP
jgi:hypothetical protein